MEYVIYYKNMFDIITIGGAVWDTLFVTDKGHIIATPENPTEQNLFAFEYGAKIVSDNVYTGAGGGAANTAVTLARLGLKAAARISLGNDQNGQMIKKILEKEKVNTELIENEPDKMTGFSFVLVDAKDGDHTIFSYRGANEKLLITNYKLLITNAKWIYVTSLTGQWQKILNDILEIKKENPSLKIAFNPGATQLAAGYEVLKDILAATDILFVNKDEAIELALSKNPGDRNRDINDIKFLFENIFAGGVKTAVITAGALGAYAGNSEKIVYSKAGSDKRLDTTGAGDAFGSAFLGSFIINGGNLEESLKYGIINSNNVVNEYGAQKGILTRDEIIKKINTVKIEYL